MQRVNTVINFIVNKCMYNNNMYIISNLRKLDECYNHTLTFCRDIIKFYIRKLLVNT